MSTPSKNESADRLAIQHVKTVDVVCPWCGEETPGSFFDQAPGSWVRHCHPCGRWYRVTAVISVKWTTEKDDR